MVRFFLVALFVCLSPSLDVASAVGDEWPTYRHDQRRSGVTTEELSVNELSRKWSWQSSLPPVSAWPDAARWDAYAQLEGLRSMRDYDSAFQPVVANGKLLIGSNADDSVHCFDLESGTRVWTRTAGGPIRVAPTLDHGIAYFGSDDGHVYAVRLIDGELLWSRELIPADDFLNDGRLCSFQPVRTGVLMDEATGTLVVGVGLFPWQPSSLFALQIDSGEVAWQRDLGTGWTIEGPMLLGAEHIVSPQGRAPPQLFTRGQGEPAGALSGGGGSFALLTEQGEILHGPGNKGGWLTASRPDSREQFASFERGISMVVRGDVAYLLDPQGVTAMDRVSQQPRWKVALRAGEELILAGSTLVVGADGYVAVLSVENGDLQWASPINGRGRGVVAAQGHLVVSTDRGEISVFGSGDRAVASAEREQWILWSEYAQRPVEVEVAATRVVGVVAPPAENYDLLEQWTFSDPRVAGTTVAAGASIEIRSDLPSGKAIQLPAHSRFIQQAEQHALVLEETVDAQAAVDFREVRYPQESLTAIAMVRIDQEQAWGGLMSMSQDNGSYERGWILGFQNRQFGFAVKGARGAAGLSWALSPTKFLAGQWYQVVGTYDGAKTSLYINGQLATQHELQSGPIDYPDKAAFQLASYRDDDEHFYSRGRLQRLALGQRALAADEVLRLYEMTCKELGESFQSSIAAQVVPEQQSSEHAAPVRGVDQFSLQRLRFEFISPGTAQVQWTTPQPSTCRLKILSGTALVQPVVIGDLSENDIAAGASQQHRWLIKDVNQREVVRFCIEQQQGSQWLASAEYQCDGHFDYTRAPLPATESEGAVNNAVLDGAASKGVEYSAATELIKSLPWRNSHGMALVVQSGGDFHVAQALCREAGLDVVLLVPAEQVEPLRQTLLAQKWYGRPISVHSLAKLRQIPHQSFNVVWANSPEREFGTLMNLEADMLEFLERCVAPEGFFIGEPENLEALVKSAGYGLVPSRPAREQQISLFRKPRLEGSAGWTHMYGASDNTAFAGETLAGATYAEQLKVVWAGRPGPRYQSDRGNRKPSPLAAGGRLYLQGHHRLIGMDAHNGSILWANEMPKMVRFNVPRDCSNWCCDDQAVYVAVEGACLKLDGATGTQLAEFPAIPIADRDMHWGFVSRESDLLIGSSVAPAAAFTGYWGKEFWYDAKDGEYAKKVASDVLFAIDAASGEERWRYDSALVINSTIAVSNGRIVFVECRSSVLQAAESRRLDGDDLWENLFVVALDVRTGEKLWEMPAKPMPGVAAMVGLITADQYLLQTSAEGEFALYSMDLEFGNMQWRGKYGWEADHHGKHLSRPAVVGNRIYLRPLTLERTTGKVLAKTFPVGHQCGTYTCSSNALFLRAGNLAMWDGNSTDATRWDRLRPDCWVSTIPAEGMLLSPEGGGGCSCGGWIETSVGFGIRATP